MEKTKKIFKTSKFQKKKNLLNNFTQNITIKFKILLRLIHYFKKQSVKGHRVRF